jgi:tetratricopeptide (TPR) repeat protein
MQASQELIIFAHIPKTAGSSINAMLEQNYSQIFNLYTKKNSSSTNVKDWIENYNQNVAESIDKNDFQTKIVRGHIGLGIHEFLKYQSCTYMTVLRHPVDRVVSHYYYFSRPESSSKLIKDDMTLEEFILQRKFSIVDNLQTRFLSGLGWQKTSVGKDLYDKKFSLKYGNCTDDMLSFAKNNLASYILFGLQDRFAESLELFKKVLRWKSIEIDTQKNVNVKRPKKDQIDPDLVKLIEAENKWDLELYNYARDLFDKQIVNLQNKPKIVYANTSWSYPSIPNSKASKRSLEISKPLTKSQDLSERRLSSMPVQLPEATQAQMTEAEQLFKEGKYAEAISKYDAIVQQNPEYVPALSKLARSYDKMGAADRAIATYQKILSLKPNKAKTQARMAKLMSKQGNAAGAIEAYKKAISLNSEQPDWVYKGLASLMKKSKKENPS